MRARNSAGDRLVWSLDFGKNPRSLELVQTLGDTRLSADHDGEVEARGSTDAASRGI